MSDDEKEEFVEKKATHSKIGNLEPVKRAFSNKAYDEFKALLEKQTPPFRYYVADYLEASEFEGRPDFIIGNRNKGFIQSDCLENNRNYLFVAFSCFKNRADSKLVFRSYWIVNSNDSLESLLESDYDQFKFDESQLETIVEGFRTGGAESKIALNYLH